MSTLYGHTFKANHLDCKLSMSCCKSQWFKSHLLFGLVRLGSELRPTPNPFQSNTQVQERVCNFASHSLLLYPNHAKRVDNNGFSEITNEAKFIM